MVLVDTSVWIDYFNGALTWHTDHLDHLLQETNVVLGDLILTEILQGFRTEVDFTRAKRDLTALTIHPLVGINNAVAAAENYRRLRKKGVTVRKTIDVLIGTFCLVNGLPLLHDDRDFDPMEQHLGLEVICP